MATKPRLTVDEYVAQLVAATPPLSEETRDRVTAALRPFAPRPQAMPRAG